MNQGKIFTVISVAFGALLLGLFYWIGYTIGTTDESRGFRLPPGDPEAGMATFARMGCANCHSVEGEPQFEPLAEFVDLVVPLGGQVPVAKTYGELVTSIIHPRESVRPEIDILYVDAEGQSIMPDFTASMTTREMIDLVAFLQDHYEIAMPHYPVNYYPYGGGGTSLIP